MQLDPDSWPALSRLLDEWLDLPAAARDRWLEQAARERLEALPALRELVSALPSDGFLDNLPRLPLAGEYGFAADMLVGPYRLTGEIGRGGMGTVWRAERADGALKRSVALKLPLLPLLDRAAAERFARERDILAQLAHPNIARLYDAGVTASGQSYLALEYVEGEPINRYCDRNLHDLAFRLRLFLQVVGAVQYAHSNLIVHRDLKPSNILVSRTGEVRLLDFGIARFLSDGETDETDATRAAGRPLTPDYASPEQLTGAPVTTASDVYSLGVVLYELLCGSRPFQRAKGAPFEPARPDDAVRPSLAVAGQAARQRSTTAGKLRKLLRGDLDNIVLRALKTAPVDRYPTADAFAQDIQRYLHGEPVLARPEPPWYRIRKFVLRYKLPVACAAAAVLSLALALGAALYEAREARIQQRTAESVQAFLQSIFRANSSAQADPVRARQTTARELLDLGSRNLERELEDAPRAKLGVLATLADLYSDLGLKDQAVAIQKKRVALARSVYGRWAAPVAAALADLCNTIGESSFAAERAALIRETEEILGRNRDFTSRTRAVLYHAIAKHYLSLDPARSAQAAARAVAIYRRYPPSLELMQALRDEGTISRDRNDYALAISRLSEAAALAPRLGAEANASLPSLYAYLADVQYATMDLDAAERSYRRALETARALHGEEHEDVVQTRYRLGNFLVLTSRPQEGLALLQEALALAVRIKGPREVFHLGSVEASYGRMLIRYGDPENGISHLDRALELRQALRATRNYAQTLDWKAGGEIDLGRFRQAAADLDEAEAIYTKSGDSPASALVRFHRLTRAALLAAAGRSSEALLQAGAAAPEKKLTFAWLDDALARSEAEAAAGQFDAAALDAAEVRARIASSGVAAQLAWYDARAALARGRALRSAGHAAEALPVLQAAVDLGSRVYHREHSPQLAVALVELAACHLALGRAEEAQARQAQARAILALHPEIGEQYGRPFRELSASLGRSRQAVIESKR